MSSYRVTVTRPEMLERHDAAQHEMDGGDAVIRATTTDSLQDAKETAARWLDEHHNGEPHVAAAARADLTGWDGSADLTVGVPASSGDPTGMVRVSITPLSDRSGGGMSGRTRTALIAVVAVLAVGSAVSVLFATGVVSGGSNDGVSPDDPRTLRAELRDEAVRLCVEDEPFFVNPMWSEAKRDREMTALCEDLIDDNMHLIDEYLDGGVGSEQLATPTTIPPTTRPLAPPIVDIDCGSPVIGPWDWYEVSFGYVFDSTAPIREIAIDYGDGNGYVARDAGDAEQNAFWHRYESPGTYLVQAWITDSNGLCGDADCIFIWEYPGG